MEGGVTPFASSMAPSGSYILIVVSQPMTEDHKKIILQRLEKGLLSWDVNLSGCDLSGLEYAFSTNIKDSVAESDVLIQHSTESLGVEVLLSPTVRTLKQCVKNLLSTQTSHKQLIHAGYTFAGSGSWILENGTFSFAEFLEIFQQADVKSQKRCILNVHCTEEGDWKKTNFAKDIFTKTADVSLNPPEKVNHVPGSEHLIRCLDSALIIQSLEEMMKPSPLVGNIRFNRPTIYMFPAGQGDCALFGINGFNMLIDGGFHRKPCSWDFVRHLDRLDAVLVTRIGESNISGISTLLKRNALNNANPQIGYVFCNITENKSNPLKNGVAETKDDLIVSVVGEGHNFVQTLNDLSLKPHQCWRDSSVDPFVLYHKVGQGTLEMHVLSPPRDSKEMKLFLSEWNAYKETFSGVKSELKGVDSMIPLSHATSICAILVWRPEDPKDTITRILFPGSAPQYKILEGLEKLKVLNILNQPVVTKASLNIPVSKVISNKVEKSISKTSIPNRNNTASPAHSISSIASRNGDIGAHKKDVIEIKRVTKEVKKDIKKEIKKDSLKDTKKEIKTENAVKKESLTKKEPVKDLKKDTKDVKKVVKKENKDLKSVNDKKDIKPAPKKESTTPTVKATSELKKTTTVRKSTTPVKKDVGKPPIAPKTSDNRKSVSKAPEPKTVKDVSNKKTVESKTVFKSKPKSTTAKTSTTPKTKPVAVPKPGSKMTKAVAASSIVASAVAVTVAAVELNEKKEVIEDTEPETSEKEIEIVDEAKEAVIKEKPDEVASPVPPEALSPTPSESVSLTPSDTLSSAPLETVSPTPPPLPNEPISTEEKDVNEIKDLEQDMPYEKEKVEEAAYDDLKTEDEINDIEAELEKHTIPDVMSASFIGENQIDDTIEEHFEKKELKVDESVPLKVDSDKEEILEKDEISESKDIEEEKVVENIVAEEEDIYKERENTYEDSIQEKDVAEEKEILEEKDAIEKKGISEEMEIATEKDIAEDNKILEAKVTEEKEIAQENSVEQTAENMSENKYFTEENDILQRESAHEAYAFQEKGIAEGGDASEEKLIAQAEDIDEEKYSAELREIGEKDVIEEKDDVKEKDVLEKITTNDKDFNKDMDEEIHDIHDENEFKNSYEDNIKEIDDQLAGLSMEGSFCAGMMSSDEKDILSATGIESAQSIDIKNSYDNYNLNYDTGVSEEEYVRHTISKDENYFTSELPKGENEKADKDIQKEFNADEMHMPTDSVLTDEYKSRQIDDESEVQSSDKIERDLQEHISENEQYHDEAIDKFEKFENKPLLDDLTNRDSPNNEHFEKFSMEGSYHQDMYRNYESTLDDLEMQETSVDEPEEITRKETIVSVTVNDESSDQHYIDDLRRKSGTESEDDVDIGKYMSKDQIVDEENLSVHRGLNSDGEDVMKSPTPHAVVDYEGQLDDEITTVKAEIGGDEKQRYLNEKEDFDEKDRDSAEEHDTDDGEMIRHPTPPGMKYSEDEMRDPIGQHFITNPNLKSQVVSDIADQPLYEEAEDSGSERSVSPIIEQPVYGNVVQADFPELVTVSGGTTPSEPQSPKSNFDAKKFANDTATMEALSEHDISDSSTHSPSCQDGSTAFDLQGSERSVIEVQSLRDEEVLKITDENEQNVMLNECASAEPQHCSAAEVPSETEAEGHDDKDEKQEDKQETPSDEEESSSEDENSESHSKDKSDAMGDKSDVERDDRSDIHNDDRSDHHHDKSDVANDDDDDKSDIRDDDQLYKQQSKYLEHEMEDGYQADLKTSSEGNAELPYNTSDIGFEKQFAYESQYQSSCIPRQFASDIDQDLDIKKDPHHFEHANIAETEINESTFADNSHELLTSNVPSLPEMRNSYQDYESSKNEDLNTMLESEISRTPEDCKSDFQGGNESVIGKNIEDVSTSEAKIEDGENSHTFQTNETNFDASQRDIDFHGFNTFAGQNENENPPIEKSSEILIDNISGGSQEVPIGFGNYENSDLYEKDSVNLQHAENVTIVDNKAFSEEFEVAHNTNLSHYSESTHTSNEMQSDSGLNEGTISNESQFETRFMTTEEKNASETNFTYTDSQMQHDSSKDYEYTSVNPDDKFSEMSISGYEHNASYNETDITNESYRKSPHFENFGKDDLKHGVESYSFSSEQYMHTETQYRESYTEKLTSETTSENFESDNTNVLMKNDFTSEIADINSNDTDKDIIDTSEHKMVNGKDAIPSILHPTEVTTEFYSSELTHQEIVASDSQQVDQQSTYLINNRFHSDSPEDNTMRTDSSPDVPYPDLSDKFPELKNTMSLETSSETYIHTTEDYKNNMNFTSTDAFPTTTENDSLNANENNAYGESSEDETNSPVRGNVSPYAYTNKAYTREEEDVDGNHIYKEETTEVIKQVEFDGNNLQTLGTNQMSSVTNYSQEYQDIQYSTGANYDFHLEEWGKPMGLPTPPDSSQKTVKKGEKLTVKSKNTVDSNGKSPSVSSRLSSPLKKPKPKVAKESSSSPVYVDLAYVPQHADPEYCDVEFFKKIRARYYVISSVNPSKEVLNALLEAKKTWNEDLSVTIIPTYETDTLGYWMAQNQDDLAEYSIDVSPSASRCTVNLQDHQTSCSAYRLEF